MQPDEKRRPLVFLAVGVLNTVLDFAFYTTLTLTIFKDNIVAAGLISGTFALLCAFLTHGLITWRGRSLKPGTIIRFFLFTGFGMWALRPILLAFFIQLEGLYRFANDISTAIDLPFSYEFIASTGAFGFMIIIVLLYNFFTYDKFVFKDR